MGNKEHFVLFPFMAQGHLIPFVAIAELLSLRRPEATVTLVNTPLNIQSIRRWLPATSAVRLRELPFSVSDYGLPSDAETVASIPMHLFINFFHASESLRTSFELLLRNLTPSPTCVIADNFLGWTVEVANRLDIFHTVFYTSGAFGQAAYYSLWAHLPHRKTAAEEFPLPDFPDIIVQRSGLPKFLKAADGNDEYSVFLRRQMYHCFNSGAALINSVEELEGKGLAMLQKVTGLPLYPIGPLLGLPSSVNMDSDLRRICLEWLEKQKPRSVLYISFGSQNTISTAQMMELAAGVEASGKPFIWAIRPPLGFDIKGEIKPEWLPEGFERRAQESNNGLLIKRWAPQREILSHAATGAFLSHCGWNSVLESLSSGVTIVGWPITGDQLYNSTMLEKEVGVCVEVARTHTEACRVDRGRVEEMVAEVMGETEKGREMRRRAMEVKETLAAVWSERDDGGGGVKGSSARLMAEFFEAVAASRR